MQIIQPPTPSSCRNTCRPIETEIATSYAKILQSPTTQVTLDSNGFNFSLGIARFFRRITTYVPLYNRRWHMSAEPRQPQRAYGFRNFTRLPWIAFYFCAPCSILWRAMDLNSRIRGGFCIFYFAKPFGIGLLQAANLSTRRWYGRKEFFRCQESNGSALHRNGRA